MRPLHALRKVDGSDNHHCAESSRIDLDCGGCGPHWGDVKACAAKCDADVTCHFFTYFHDDGCRIYTKSPAFALFYTE